MLKQVTLDPWLPGGFIDIWIRWIAARSPDYVEKKLDVWKILGGCLLNTACKVIANVEPVRTGNMLIALIGPYIDAHCCSRLNYSGRNARIFA